MTKSRNTPWNKDNLARNRNRREKDDPIDIYLLEIKRKKDELEHKRLVEQMTREVWE
jgi:hypothetical protein